MRLCSLLLVLLIPIRAWASDHQEMLNQEERQWLSASAAEALLDPIPAKIPAGDIVVAVQDFIRMPRTQDSSDNLTNAAFARIQYMVPFGGDPDLLAVNDSRGVLYRVDEREAKAAVYLDLRQQDVGFDDSMFPNEMGLASVAFHPEFISVGKPGYGKFYTAYSAAADTGVADYLDDDAASHESVIREWTSADPEGDVFSGESRELFRIGQFAPNHNIGMIAFNPAADPGSADYGLLYASLGDGGAANDPREYGQALSVPHSAVIRIDPLGEAVDGGRAYGIPADNPFINTGGAAPEVWVYGLRHAQHFSWDRSGRMFLNDIGQNQVEEVNLAIAGANYGWRLREGTFATAFDTPGGEPGRVYALAGLEDPFTYPVAQYDHDEGSAIGSGYVYEGQAINALRGKYVFADIVRGRIFYIDAQTLAPGRLQAVQELRLSFDGTERALADVASIDNTYQQGKRVDLRLGVDNSGELYLLTKADGLIRKLMPLKSGDALSARASGKQAVNGG